MLQNSGSQAITPQMLGKFARTVRQRIRLKAAVTQCHRNVSSPMSSERTKAIVADGVGFEPTDAFTSLVFKTSALNHSATHPRAALLTA